MWSVWCWVLLTLFKGTSQYSIFGGNAYGYTGSSHCAAFNGCVSREIEDEDGKPKATFGPSGTRQTGEPCTLGHFEQNVKNGHEHPAITQVTSKTFPIKIPIENNDRDSDDTTYITSYEAAEDLVNGCADGTARSNPVCEKWLTRDKAATTRLQELFKYQLLVDDNSVLRNNQGAVWRWRWTTDAKSYAQNLGWGDDVNKREELLNKKCDPDCMEKLYLTCEDVSSIRHVKDWCTTILSWIESSGLENLDKYQHYLLNLVGDITTEAAGIGHDRQIQQVSREERAVLVAAAASTVFLTKGLFLFPSASQKVSSEFGSSIERLGYPAIHSLFIANYVGRLRVTLHKIPYGMEWEEWYVGREGALVTTSERTVERARNYEGLTGSVYASIAALFNEQNKNERQSGYNKRFRLEIAEANGIGCVEQTTGMVFIRPADWAVTAVTWKSIGPKRYAPSGVIALDAQNRSTFEITEGGLVMYPVAIGDLLVTKTEDSVCNSAKGNWKAEQQSFNLKGIGGMCNWVPTW